MKLQTILPWLAGAAHLAIAALAAGHAILHKRDVRAAIGWSAVIILSPFAGALAYYFFGINRIRRRAARLVALRPELPAGPTTPSHVSTELAAHFDGHLARLSRTIEKATGAPLATGNAVSPLVNGDEAYPQMLDAISEAERSVLLTTYIFDHDRAGRTFVDALSEAEARGVAVRVLVDAVGKRYSRPPITRARGSGRFRWPSPCGRESPFATPTSTFETTGSC